MYQFEFGHQFSDRTNAYQQRLPTDNNLIISADPPEPLQYGQSPCLSECRYTIEIFKQKSCQSDISEDQYKTIEPPPPSRMANNKTDDFAMEVIVTNPMSPERLDEAPFLPQVKSIKKTSITIPQNQQTQQDNPQSRIKRQKTNSDVFVGTSLMQFFILKKFIGRMLWNRRQLAKVGPYQLQLINDKTAVYSQSLFQLPTLTSQQLRLRRIINRPEGLSVKIWNSGRLALNRCISKMQQWEQQIPLFYPQSVQKVVWDIFLTLIRVYFMLMIPLQLSFSSNFLYSLQTYYPTLFFTLFLLIDLIISFNTPYYEFGQIVTNRNRIAINTIMKSFGLEVLSVIYLVIMLSPSDPWQQIGLILFVVQFQNIAKILRQCEEVLNLSKRQTSILQLVKLIFIVMYVLHLFSCLWYWCGDYSSQQWGKSWIIKNHLENSNWEVLYLYSFYYSTVTMFTVGYGDYTPQSIPLIYSRLLGNYLFDLFHDDLHVNTVGAIIDQISKQSEEKLKYLRILNTYMHKKRISYDLQFQIREYLNYYWESQQAEESYKEKEIIEQLSEQLKEKLMVEANSIILKGSPLFTEIFSSQCVMKLIKVIKSVVIQPENIIDFCKIGSEESSNNYLSFIEKGSIEIIIENKDQGECKLKELVTGENFGLFGFLSGIQSKEKFKSIGFTKLILICRDDLIKILNDFPEDKEKFCLLRDDILFNGGQKASSQLHQLCFSCNSTSHRITECPIIHYVPDRERLIKTIAFSRDQMRNEFIVRRLSRSTFQALADQSIIAEVAQYIQTDYWKFTQAYESQESGSDRSSEERESMKRRRKSSVQSLKDIRNQKPNKQITIPLEQINEDGSDQDRPLNLGRSIRDISKSRTAARKSTKILKQNCSPAVYQSQDSSQLIKSPSMMHSPESIEILSNSFLMDEGKKTPLKGVLKNSRSLTGDQTPSVVSKDKLQKIKIKFKRALEFVSKMNMLKNKYSKRSPRFSVDNLLHHQQLAVEQAELQEQHAQIQLRVQKKQLFKSQLDQDHIELLNLSLSKQLLPKIETYGFERIRNFKYYKTQDNLLGEVQFLKQGSGEAQLFSKLIKYLLYPHEYINRYKNHKVQISKPALQESKNKEPKKFAQKISTYKDILKVRNKARMIIQSRQLGRVQPFNE